MAVSDPKVAEEPVRVVMNPLIAVKRFVKILVEVAFPIVKFEMLVVARVVEPVTPSVPLAIRFPFASAEKFMFSAQVVPFQYRVDPVAVPPFTVPTIVYQ